MEAAHFPKEPTHTGLTILDRLPKKKKNTLKATKLTSYRNFRMIQALIKSIERSTVERLEENSNDLSRCLFNANKHKLIWPWRNEEQKVDKLRKRHYTRMAVLQSLISLWKRKGKRKGAAWGIRIWSPTQVLTSSNWA